VTGASRGLGWAIAKALSAEGATVVLNSRDAVSLNRCADEITAAGGKADVAPFDVIDHGAVQAAIEAIARRHGNSTIGSAARHLRAQSEAAP
jgi:gluconate 5-dehydrogenase